MGKVQTVLFLRYKLIACLLSRQFGAPSGVPVPGGPSRLRGSAPSSQQALA